MMGHARDVIRKKANLPFHQFLCALSVRIKAAEIWR